MSMKGIGGLPFENLFFGLMIMATLLNVLNISSVSYYFLFVLGLIFLLSIYGLVFNKHHPYFKNIIFLKELLALSGIFVGYILGTNYNFSLFIHKLYHLSVLLCGIVIITYPVYDLGLISNTYSYSNVRVARKILPLQFHVIFFLSIFSPVIIYYFKLLGDVRKQKIALFLFYFVIFSFSIRSATRSVLILGLLSFIITLYKLGLLRKYTFAFLLVLPLLAIYTSNSYLFQRFTNFSGLEAKGGRVEEVTSLYKDFKKNGGSFLTGTGIGVGNKKHTGILINDEWITVHVTLSPHIGFIAPLFKGGIVFFFLFLFPLFYMLVNTLYVSSKLYSVLFYSLGLYYLQALMSGGYVFYHFFCWALVFSLSFKVIKFERQIRMKRKLILRNTKNN